MVLIGDVWKARANMVRGYLPWVCSWVQHQQLRRGWTGMGPSWLGLGQYSLIQPFKIFLNPKLHHSTFKLQLPNRSAVLTAVFFFFFSLGPTINEFTHLIRTTCLIKINTQEFYIINIVITLWLNNISTKINNIK